MLRTISVRGTAQPESLRRRRADNDRRLADLCCELANRDLFRHEGASMFDLLGKSSVPLVDDMKMRLDYRLRRPS